MTTTDFGQMLSKIRKESGLNQKQAVAILYAISAILGLAAVTLTTNGALRILLLLIALVIAVSVWAYIARTVKLHPHAHNSNVTGEKHEKEQH